MDQERENKKRFLRVIRLSVQGTYANIDEKKDALVKNFVSICENCGIKNVAFTDISSVAFVKTPGDVSNETLIFEMRNEHCKVALYSQRSNLKKNDSKIYINECPTKQDSSLFKKCRQDVRNGDMDC